MQHIRNTIRGIVIKDEKLLTIRIADGDDEYYILPGGQLELNETAIEALQRECREELGCDVSVKECLFIREFIGARRQAPIGSVGDQHLLELYFRAHLKTEPDLLIREAQQKEIAWISIEALSHADIKPEFLQTAIPKLLAQSSPTNPYMGDVD
tara:strand:+ start:46713 stop:47174 length:462 start_codon:yes stop_codon:yes gene_type:complete